MSIAGTVLSAYGAVLFAEVVGDKLLYTSAILATRYRVVPVLVGVAVASMAKMALAVAFGSLLRGLPSWLLASASAVGFSWAALSVYRQPSSTRTPGEPSAAHSTSASGALAAFGMVLLSEWADPGQLAAATLAASFGATASSSHGALVGTEIWLGAVAAMQTKAAIAAMAGQRARAWLRARFTPSALRVFGAAALALLGSIAVAEALLTARS